MDMFKNRLEKNLKKLKPWAQRNKLEAFRIFDRDIPEIQYIVDLYGAFAVVYDKTDSVIDQGKNLLPVILDGVTKVTGLREENIIVKKRERQEGTNQYEKLATVGSFFTVQEGEAKFKVNLQDYLDTGLFLDHRPMRNWVFKNAKDKKFLNLFCYTGSVSVFAALAGAASTTSVDMSATYLKWASENFELNGISTEAGKHKFIQENALEFLAKGAESKGDSQSESKSNFHYVKYDLIFLDPPTFSNSKRMDGSFEVERDQDFLVQSCMKLLNPNGLLIFSNNKRKFKLSDKISSTYHVQDMTEMSIPMDFHDKKIHRCFFIKEKNL